MLTPPTVPESSDAEGQSIDALLRARLAEVGDRIARAAARVGRDPADVLLVAVTKQVDARRMAAAVAMGQRDLGENRAQELRAKLAEPALADVRWHFVGRLQRNKVPDVVGRVRLVHSVDRVELAEAMAARARTLEIEQRVLVQVNTGADPAKAGSSPAEAGELVARVRALPGLRCEGLMTVPPLGVDPRPSYAALAALRTELAARDPEIRHLSMGMSGDLEAAVEEGATIVRVGQALFGPRPVPSGAC